MWRSNVDFVSIHVLIEQMVIVTKARLSYIVSGSARRIIKQSS